MTPDWLTNQMFIIIIIIIVIYWLAHLSQSFQINSERRRAESFEACCQWVLLNVQVVTLLGLFTFIVQKYINFILLSVKVHAGSFSVSVIHQTLTWTTGSLACVHDHSCVYTPVLGPLTASQHNILEQFSQSFLMLLTGFEPRVFGSRVQHSTNWATTSPLCVNNKWAHSAQSCYFDH